MRHSSRRAFTLIELLVVIAIIAILAGIIFPVFSKARERAFTADCTSNIRQLGMAFTMYLSDWNNRFPSAGNGSAAALVKGSDWVHINAAGVAGDMSVEQGSLFSYVKSTEAYVCRNAIAAADPAQSGGTRTSYTMNSNLVNNSTWLGLKSNRVKFPSQTFLLVEENDELPLGYSPGQYNDAVLYAPEPSTPGTNTGDDPPGLTSDSERHGGGALACYIDGHAKWQVAVDLAPYGATRADKTALGAYYFPFRTKVDQYP